MYKGIYISMTGMFMRENELSAVSHNLANINTTGYKRKQFASTLYPLLSGRPTERNAIYLDARAQTYFGTQFIDTSQGNLKQTGNPFELAVQEEGFFAVQRGQKIFYTREGSFTRDRDNFLITQSGLRVLDENNNPIVIDGTRIEIGNDGTIFVDGNQVAKIKLVKLNNIRHVGQSLYEGNEAGQADGQIFQGWIESSNVNPLNELVNMIQAIRNFEFAQRITTNFDQLAQRAVSEIARL
ncbi:MAG: flagellar hook basal-body protein [Thermodesulfovibrio sp.]|uniref:flagellar hook-basal body protein n=1 Tax=Thermodesulfovibrio sp. 1176 TaxID=3043424 RepID=UPI0024830DB7|nr:flagellar hook basal-body protein [Thermodesulfovibrio sp. 1176]MDI1471795.1 flagellar hook basal-body protein [Thermodesulfovibrio sp. 1176]MDI6713685.1 flagellar hook basal-body protein [Thermodesulfovibrio sp.]